MVSDEDIPLVVYSLAQPIRSKILNYKKFVNPEPQHVLTGNLKIVKNNNLRKLLSKGPKYREPVEIKWEDAKGVVEDGSSKLEKLHYS